MTLQASLKLNASRVMNHNEKVHKAFHLKENYEKNINRIYDRFISGNVFSIS